MHTLVMYGNKLHWSSCRELRAAWLELDRRDYTSAETDSVFEKMYNGKWHYTSGEIYFEFVNEEDVTVFLLKRCKDV